MSLILWAILGAAFLWLETLGLRSETDRWYTLTHHLRAAMRSPVGLAVRIALAIGWLWLGWHLFFVDVSNPGALA